MCVAGDTRSSLPFLLGALLASNADRWPREARASRRGELLLVVLSRLLDKESCPLAARPVCAHSASEPDYCMIACQAAARDRYLQYISHNAYIYVSVLDLSFCEGAKQAFELTMRNIGQVLSSRSDALAACVHLHHKTQPVSACPVE